MNEFEFIHSLREQTRSRKHSARVVTGIGDDASVIRQSPNRDLIVTTDLLIEGIDFHHDAAPPRMIGHKALAVSLSDIAAMGARPMWSLLSMGLPSEVWRDNFKDEFTEGYLALADQYGVTLAGGDVSESKAGIVIDSIVIGEVTSGTAILRSGAHPGDQIFVTGTLGGAAAGLKLIQMGARVNQRPAVRDQASEAERVVTLESRSTSPCLREGSVSEPRAVATGSDDAAIQALLLRQLKPQPRVGWGIVLCEEHLATSMIDLSDGLSSDLAHLSDESNVGALLDADALPLDEDVRKLCGRRALDPLALALHGGEDLELLFTVHPDKVVHLPKRVDGISISRIGEITNQRGVVKLAERNRIWDLQPQGFEHFKDAV